MVASSGFSNMIPGQHQFLKKFGNNFQGEIEDDANVPDRAEDIKPRFHKARTQGMNGESSMFDNDNALESNVIFNLIFNFLKFQLNDEDVDDESCTEWNLSKD